MSDNLFEKQFELSEAEFKRITGLVYKFTHISMNDSKKELIYSRISKRLKALNLNSFSEYCDYLESDHGSAEHTNFINAVTTNLTSFFRENHHFEHLKEFLKPLVLKARKNNNKIRIWSAGCSTGPEPYSIAMIIYEAIGNSLSGLDIKILATDIDTEVLETASKGIYNKKEIETIPIIHQKYIKNIMHNGNPTDQFIMSDNLRKLITFKKLNLLENWPMKGKFDIIFCRNVVIYFDKPTQEKLFRKFADYINKEGILYIGHSENIGNLTNLFQLKGKTIYQKL